MQCPYCRHPLEPLIIQGRHTGAFQCIRCSGSWLHYQQFGGLLGSGSSGVALTRRSPGGNLPVAWQPGAGATWQGGSSVLYSPPSLQGGYAPGMSGGQDTFSEGYSGGRTSPWEALGSGPSPRPLSGPGRAAAPPKMPWWRRKTPPEVQQPPENPDWDLCTYCGQLHPGAGPNCAHCNVERMRCPSCSGFMIGVRRQKVLLDLCIGCQGAFFEKGRLEQLLDQMRGMETEALGEAATSSSPSLLQQLAAFLEDTEPSPYSVGNRESTGVLETFTSAMSAGLGGGRQVLYDLLVMLGDIPSPGGKTGKGS